MAAVVLMSRRKPRGGLYLWRTRKPHAPLGLPIIGRHNGYGGMTNSFARRGGEHLNGTARYEVARPAASWSDLDPKCYRIPISDWWFGGDVRRGCVKLAETLFLAVTCCVYNDKQQPPWNFRKISRRRAAALRAQRDALGSITFTARFVARLFVYTMLITVALLIWEYAR